MARLMCQDQTTLPTEQSTELSFTVAGLPVPSGSRRVLPVRRQDGRQTYRLVADKRAGDWIATVRCKAQEVMVGEAPWDGPIRVELEFRFPRPLAHYRGGRRGEGRLRADAPQLVLKRPDLDKLCRAVLDALTGVCWLDDCQVAWLTARKWYHEAPSVFVRLQRLQ